MTFFADYILLHIFLRSSRFRRSEKETAAQLQLLIPQQLILFKQTLPTGAEIPGEQCFLFFVRVESEFAGIIIRHGNSSPFSTVSITGRSGTFGWRSFTVPQTQILCRPHGCIAHPGKTVAPYVPTDKSGGFTARFVKYLLLHRPHCSSVKMTHL